MKNFDDATMTIKKIKTITCNCCGENIKMNKSGDCYDYVNIEKTWGYFSPLDGETHSMDICSRCYSNIVKSFKIPPFKER